MPSGMMGKGGRVKHTVYSASEGGIVRLISEGWVASNVFFDDRVSQMTDAPSLSSSTRYDRLDEETSVEEKTRDYVSHTIIHRGYLALPDNCEPDDSMFDAVMWWVM